MFCRNCGNEVPDSVKFCPKCGAQIIPAASAGAGAQTGPAADSTQGAAPQDAGTGTTEAPAEKKRRKIWIPVVIIIAVVAVVLIVLAATGVLSRKTVKLNNYLSVEFNGYDGYGTARVRLDTYELGEDYDGKIKVTDEAEDWGFYYFSDVVDDAVYVYASPGGSLSNGDEVTVDWNVYLDYFDEMIKGNVKLTYEAETYTVSDLEPVESFDAFAGITVEFSGISPDAHASIEYSGSAAGVPDSVWDYLDCTLSRSEDLAVGDTVTVTISEESANDLMQSMGLHPEEMSKDYVVEGIPYYVTSLDQIPEDGMEKMIAQANDVRTAKTANGTFMGEGKGTLTHEYIGSWFLCEKSGLNKNDVNLIYMVYKMHASAAGENDDGSEKRIEQDYYWYCGFRNGMVLDDGTFSIDYSDYFEPSGSYSWWSGISGEALFIDGISDILFSGYENLDSMFNNLVTSMVSDYTYESTVDESAAAAEPEESSGQEGDEDADADAGTDAAAAEKLTGLTATASSQLDDEEGYSYGPDNLFDGDLSTAYAEGVSGVGSGEEIDIALDGEYTIDRISWNPGYQKSADLLDKNGYPTKLTFYFSDGTSVSSTVSESPDVGTAVDVEIPEGTVTDSIRVVIDEAAAGSKFEDTCISEIEIYGYSAP